MIQLDSDYQEFQPLEKSRLFAIANDEMLPALHRGKALSVIVQRDARDPDARRFIIEELGKPEQSLEWRAILISGASNVQFPDKDEREILRPLLLKHAKQLFEEVKERGVMPSETSSEVSLEAIRPPMLDGALWSVIRRYASMTPIDTPKDNQERYIAELCQFMDPAHGSVCQVAFQAIEDIFQNRPANGRDYPIVRQKVASVVSELMTTYGEDIKAGGEASLLLSGLKAMAVLGDPELKTVIKECASLHPKWLLDLSRRQLATLLKGTKFMGTQLSKGWQNDATLAIHPATLNLENAMQEFPQKKLLM